MPNYSRVGVLKRCWLVIKKYGQGKKLLYESDNEKNVYLATYNACWHNTNITEYIQLQCHRGFSMNNNNNKNAEQITIILQHF
jgi:hypothetical protein